MIEKPIVWLGSTLEDIRAFPEDSRRLAGHYLHLVQQGLDPPDWKPMRSVGPGVYEIRIRTRVERRIFYISKFREALYVLHVFEKRTQATRQRDIDLAKSRMNDLLKHRQTQRGQRRK
jgi:phage-related protein